MSDTRAARAATVAAVQLFSARKGRDGLMARDSILPLLDQAKRKEAELALFPLIPTRGTLAEFKREWSELARAGELFVGAARLFTGAAQNGERNVAFLFGPDGSVLLEQAQTHLTRVERENGLIPGEDLDVADLPFGRVGFAVGTDCWYPEVSRILALRGVDIILAPVAVPRPYGFWQQAAGLWEEVQQNQVFGIEAGLAGYAALDANGEGKKTIYEGRTAIMAPVEVTPGETGYLAHVLGPAELMDEDHAGMEDAGMEATSGRAAGAAPQETPAAEDEAGLVVTARLEPAMLEEARRAFPIFHFLNVPLYRKWIPAVYEEEARR